MGNKGSEPAAAPATHIPNSRAAPVSQELQTVHSLRQKIEDLEKRRTFLENKCNNEVKLGKEKLKAGNKAAATQHLKRKKLYEKEVGNIGNMINTLESQAMALESGASTVQAVKAMKAGANAQKQQMKELDPDAVSELQNDIADLQTQHDEVTNLFANNTDPLVDAEIADELEALQLEEEEPAPIKVAKTKKPAAAAAAPAAAVSFPTAPTGAVKVKAKPAAEEEEDDELRALEAEFG